MFRTGSRRTIWLQDGDWTGGATCRGHQGRDFHLHAGRVTCSKPVLGIGNRGIVEVTLASGWERGGKRSHWPWGWFWVLVGENGLGCPGLEHWRKAGAGHSSKLAWTVQV